MSIGGNGEDWVTEEREMNMGYKNLGYNRELIKKISEVNKKIILLYELKIRKEKIYILHKKTAKRKDCLERDSPLNY